MESMDEKPKDAATAKKNEKEEKISKHIDNIGAAILLSFPSNHPDPTPHLAPLRDKHSTYMAVAKSCLFLNQFALNGSSSTMEDVHSVESSSLFHDGSFATSLSAAFSGLMETIQNHDDRRAKIVCCKTLATLARATYARIRHSPHLFAMRDSTNNRLEDEVGTDVPMTLVSAALDDPDDGVATSAIYALGTMTLSTSSTPGTLVEDELLREILAMIQGRPAPYAPTVAVVMDEDSKIPQMELQTRIFENVISPRLLQLVCRITAFDSLQHIRMILPVLTASLVHLAKTSPPAIYGMDRTTYVKRWVELDFVNLVNDVVEVLLLPVMQSSLDGQLSTSAAVASIRLVHACPHAPWVRDVLYWAILVLKEEFASVSSLEAKLTTLSTLVIACRAVPLPERSPTLKFVFEKVLELPCTTMAPHGIHSPGLLLELPIAGIAQYRRPARVAFFAEIALSYLGDGPVESTENAKVRSGAFDKFMKSSEAVSAIKDTQSGKVIQIREEFVLTFCMMAVEVGRKLRSPQDNGGDMHKSASQPQPMVVTTSQDDFLEWVRMSLTMLNSFSSCLSWSGSSSYMEEELSLLVAAQASYIRLAQELLHAAGMLSPTSVSLRMAPTASPPNMLWDQMEESAAYLGKYETVGDLLNNGLKDKISKIMDNFISKELKGSGVVSHHMRAYLLALAADQWVFGRFLAIKKEYAGSNGDRDKNGMNVQSTSNLLTALCPRRIFSKVVESHKSQIENYGKKKKELYKKYSQDTVTACVACIENIALAVCDWKKQFGNNADIKTILNLAVQSLQGKTAGNDDSQSPVLPVCQGAIERIQAAFSSNEQASIDTMSILSSTGELKRRPVVRASRSNQGKDSYNEGYMMQLIRQIAASRADQFILSTPMVQSFQGEARKQNWLRLALPPLPAARNPQVSVNSISRFSWGSCVSAPSGGSDAAAMTLAYSVRRNLRYDGESEFRLMVVMRVHNVTAVEVPDGLCLELGIAHETAATSLDAMDPTSVEIRKSLLEGSDELSGATALSSAVAIYKHELKSGDHITWEIMLDALPMTGAMSLHPSIVYRSMEEEAPYATWVAADTNDADGEASVASAASQKSASKSLDGSSKGDLEEEKKESSSEKDEKQHITIPGDSMQLSPMVGLQPCPLVFFRDGCGDIDTFRFLWSRMPCQTPPLKVALLPNGDSLQVSFDTLRLAAISMIRFPGESIPGGYVTKLWAFMAFNGKRVLFVMAQSEADTGKNGSKDKTIHVRGDDKDLLSCLTGTFTARRHLVAALERGLHPL